jgi:dual specificity MAP kinase phosphatase
MKTYNRYYSNYFGLRQSRLSKISENLYLGSMFDFRGAKVLKDSGITAVVDMRKSKPLFTKEFRTLHLPTKNWRAPSIKDLEQGIRFIGSEIEKGGKVYIHCRAGKGRGPTMTAAYLISKGMKLHEALGLVKKMRSVSHTNKAQKKVLQILYHKVNSKKNRSRK